MPALAATALVTNQGDDTVSVVDTTTGTVRQTVAVGAKPAGIAVAPGGRRAYVTNPEGHSLSVLTVADGLVAVSATIPAGAGPLGVAVVGDGRIFIADWYGNTVSVLEPVGHTVVGTITVGQSPSGLASDAAGRVLFVANRESDTLSVVDLATLAVVATIPAGRAPFGVTVHGTRVYVANVQSNDLSVLDAINFTEIHRLPVGEFPYAVAVTPDGSRILVTNQHGGTVSVFDGTYHRLPDIEVGEYPEGIAVSADGSRAYVATWMDNRLAEIDIGAGKVVRKIKVGESPRAFGTFLIDP